ncbi:MAG: PEP-CTERM sorting domain-containing protein [Planctomycetota bacterium]|nr:PEP-CTERM sorting domain-containing protein [Planctomycetota bacterium]
MKTTMIAALAGTMFATAAFAQSGSGVTLTAGTVTFTQADWQTTPTATAATFLPTSVPQNFKISDLGPNGSNAMGGNMWFYRISSFGRARNFNNATNKTVTANTASWDFSLDGSINAKLSMAVTQPAAGQGKLVQTLSLTNVSGADITFQLFNWAKFHAFIPAANAVSGSATKIQGTQTPSSVGSLVTASLSSTGAVASNRWQMDPSSNSNGVLNSIINTNNYALNNAASGNVNSQNPMGALQWQNLFIANGDTVTVETTFLVVPAPSSLALLGLGGLVAGRRRR